VGLSERLISFAAKIPTFDTTKPIEGEVTLLDGTFKSPLYEPLHCLHNCLPEFCSSLINSLHCSRCGYMYPEPHVSRVSEKMAFHLHADVRKVYPRLLEAVKASERAGVIAFGDWGIGKSYWLLWVLIV
jgi:hypothetical protein